MPATLRGLGVSRGYAAGPVVTAGTPPPLPPLGPVDDVEAEIARAATALDAVAADLYRRADHVTEATAADILRAQAMMAEDPVLRESIAEGVRGGADAPHAIAAALAVHKAAFEAAGGYLAQRASDLDDLLDRAVAGCLGLPMPGIPAPGYPFVLLARDLAPADTAGLDPHQVLALVTEVGGPTSHTAILARALGLPAVVSCPGLRDVADGTLVTVDGVTGIVETGVDEAAVARTLARQYAERERLERSSGPGRTADGHPVPLLANIGSVRDLDDGGAEGVGLLRSELPYLDRVVAPGLDEQAEAYAEVFAAMSGRKVVVRTLDVGADKPLPFLGQVTEPNPALGVRGLRLSRNLPELLRTQLAAIARAAGCDGPSQPGGGGGGEADGQVGAAGADVWVMAPMVATVAEAERFVAECRAVGLPTAGVMVEVPAAAMVAPQLLAVVDFLSIGTNDLSQYLFAADRMCGDLADLLDPYQPALLRMIRDVAAAGLAAGKPVGVCGEAAADPGLALVLAGLGVTSLSMSPRAIAAVREALAGHTLDECRRLAELVLAAPDAGAARGILERHRADA